MDTDDELEKKLKYYEKYYEWMHPKFLELIDTIFLREYKYGFGNGEYYDIVLFLIKSNMIKTLKFLLEYGLRRRERYQPNIEEQNYHLLKYKSVIRIQRELSFYYFLDENKISNIKILDIQK